VGASSEEEGRKKGMEDENRGELSIENRHDNFMFHECHGYLGSESVGMGWGENEDEDEDEDECSRGGREVSPGEPGRRNNFALPPPPDTLTGSEVCHGSFLHECGVN
jgi:hypothetical protein